MIGLLYFIIVLVVFLSDGVIIVLEYRFVIGNECCLLLDVN